MTKILSSTVWVSVAVLMMFAVALPAFALAPAWDTSGAWVVDFEYEAAIYQHDMTLAQDGAGALTGGGGYIAGGPHTYEWVIDSGAVDGSTIHLETHYTLGAVCDMTIDGVVAGDGSMSGTWSDNCGAEGATRTGTWTTSSGEADPIAPAPTVATDKNQCKNGGWMTLVDANGNSFKNQGQCVSSTVPAAKGNGGGPTPV